MKYYSEVTARLYDTEKELKEAEAEKRAELDALEEKRKEKERRRQEVIQAYDEAHEYMNKANKLAELFYNDYKERFDNPVCGDNNLDDLGEFNPAICFLRDLAHFLNS